VNKLSANSERKKSQEKVKSNSNETYLSADLVTALAGLQMDNFSHFAGGDLLGQKLELNVVMDRSLDLQRMHRTVRVSLLDFQIFRTKAQLHRTTHKTQLIGGTKTRVRRRCSGDF